MFIRRTTTRRATSGESYYSYRLVESRREGSRVRQVTLRAQLNTQRRIAARFKQRDGRTLHIRKATQPDAAQPRIYNALGLDLLPGGTRKLVVDAAAEKSAPAPGM